MVGVLFRYFIMLFYFVSLPGNGVKMIKNDNDIRNRKGWLIQFSDETKDSDYQMKRNLFQYVGEVELIQEKKEKLPSKPDVLPPSSAEKILQYVAFLANGDKPMALIIANGESRMVCQNEILLDRFLIKKISPDQVLLEENGLEIQLLPKE